MQALGRGGGGGEAAKSTRTGCQYKSKSKWVILYTSLLSSFVLVLYLRARQQDWMTYIGYAVFTPSAVLNASMLLLTVDTCQVNKSLWSNIHSSSSVIPENHSFISNTTVPFFDQSVIINNTVHDDDNFSLSRKWKVLSESRCINTSHLDSNVCLQQRHSHSTGRVLRGEEDTVTDTDTDTVTDTVTDTDNSSGVVTCLPSLMIIGFEKCSTTQLLLWLSYHPNLLGRWQVGRIAVCLCMI